MAIACVVSHLCRKNTMQTQDVYNLIILDESGSMQSIKQSTISGFNEVVQTIREVQKTFPEQRHFVSLVSFSGNQVRTLINSQPVDGLRELGQGDYGPNGSTPLYDAIGLSVTRLRYDQAGNKEAKFLVTILTDGEENSSREFNSHQVQALIRELKEKGWTFTYIGANHDVEKTAFSLSIMNTMTFQADPAAVTEMFNREKDARMNYSRKMRNKENLDENYYQ